MGAIRQEREDQLSEIRSLTSRMLELSDAESWAEIADLEASRSHIIHSFFDEAPTVDEAPTIASTIKEVLDVDRRIIERGEAARSAVVSEMRGVSKGFRAVQAYDNTGP